MEELTDQTIEVQDELDRIRSDLPFEAVNLLAGLYLTLDQLRGVYAGFAAYASRIVGRHGTSVGTFGENSTDETLRWVETCKFSSRVGQGGKERASGRDEGGGLPSSLANETGPDQRLEEPRHRERFLAVGIEDSLRSVDCGVGVGGPVEEH